MKKRVLIQILVSGIFTFCFSQEKLTYPDLVKRLYDMEYLATPPEHGEQSGNFSSFDRSSSYNPKTETYDQWEAGNDGTGYIRKEGNGIVVFEKDGPGVIWRVWSALALSGHIKIYVDHQEQPIIDMSFSDFFEQINEDGIELPKELPGYPSINLPNLMPTLSRGRNRFIPIPYQKHCKIVLEKEWGMFYHITYTTFPEQQVNLPYFDGIHRKDDCITLAEADRVLVNRGFTRKQYSRETIKQKNVILNANQGENVTTLQGNGAITHFNIKYEENIYQYEADREELLKNVWIRITWDNDEKEAVLAPLGMFFGTYPDVYPNRTLPIGALPGYLYSNWYMPFSEAAKIELINKGDRRHNLGYEIAHIGLEKSADQLLRFHAKWHKGKFRHEVQTQGRDIDWPLLVTKGKGRFCGVTLHIQNEWEEPEKEAVNWWYGKYAASNIWWWWGEGDEKFYVDGEKFPSTFGTGSEDYIGYAWSAEPAFPLFDSGFASQPFTAIDGNGHTIVSRFHISDNIPFQESFTAVIEKYKDDKWGDKERGCTHCPNICLYQAVAYWYLSPGQSDGY